MVRIKKLGTRCYRMCFETLVERVAANVTEKRRTEKGNIRHKLIDIIFISLCTCLSGGTSYEQIEVFGSTHKEWLKKYLELPNGIPSAETFQRVLEMTNPKELSKALFEWLSYVRKKNAVISIDGKTIRGSGNDDHHAYHVVSAFISEHCLTLGEVKTSEKSNEITAVPELLKLIDVEGAIVTADAMSCQAEIVESLANSGADYVLCLKGNQGNLHREVKNYVEDMLGKLDFLRVEESGHGRHEIREFCLINKLEWLKGKERWKNLNGIGIVRSTIKRDGKQTTEIRYFLTSLQDVETFSYSVREHWGIENKLHWVLDVVFKEDSSSVKKANAPLVFNELRKTSLHLLSKKKKKQSYNTLMYRASMDTEFLEEVLFG